MKPIGYYRFEDVKNYRNAINLCSVESDMLPLVVNAIGHHCREKRFLIDNVEGRLDYYLIYLEKGKITMRFPDGDKDLTAGDFVIIPPRTSYCYSYEGDEEMSYLCVHFTGSQAQQILDGYGLACYPAYHTIEEDGGVRRKFRPMFDNFFLLDQFRDREIAALFDRVLIFLGRRLANGGRDFKQLAASLQLIHSSYQEDIRVATLARLENLSVPRYNVIFRRQFGMAPMEYLIKLRIAGACELLSTTDLAVKEIGAAVGYEDPHFFSRIFRSRMGMSPNQYRNRVGDKGR